MINEARLLKVLLAPHVSEKATLAAEQTTLVVFKVCKYCELKQKSKRQLKNCSKLKLTGVRTLNVKGKTKRHGHRFGTRSDWKKAYVTA